MKGYQKALIALVVLVVGAYFGIKWYVARDIKKNLDEALQAAALFVTVRYDGIDAGFDGTLRIKGVRIEPNMIADTFTVDEIAIKTPGILFLMNGAKEIKASRQLPETMTISLRGATMSLRGGFAEMMSQQPSGGLSMIGSLPPPPGCGGHRLAGVKGLRQLGYDKLVSDLRITYTFEKGTNRLRFDTEQDVKDMGLTLFSFTLQGVGRDIGRMQGAPRIAQVKVTYRDRSFAERLVQFCSQAAKSATPADFINAVPTQPDAAWQRSWGFVPNNSVRTAYQKFLAKPGEYTIEIRPSEPIELASLAVYKPEQLVDVLMPTLNVSGEPVTDLSFKYLPALDDGGDDVAEGEDGGAPASAPAAAKADSAKKTPDNKPRKRGFHPVPVANLGKHIGDDVRITLKDGVVREGGLLSFDGKVAEVERRYDRALVTNRVPVGQIKRLEVFFE